MRREERGNHVQRGHFGELVAPDKLCVHHDGPHVVRAALPRLAVGGDHLVRRGVAVAVHQNLPVLAHRLQHTALDLRVAVDRIAAVIRVVGIGRGHPCGAPLRRAVQKQLVAADAQTAAIARRIRCVFVQQPGAGDVHVGDDVGRELFAHGGEQRPFRRARQALLNRRDAVSEVDALGGEQALHGLVRAGARRACGDLREGRLLEVSVRRAVRIVPDDAACGRGGVPRDAERLQSRRIQNAHVAGSVREQRGVLREHRVEKGGGRVRALGERRRVVAEAHDPRAGRKLPLAAEGLQARGDFIKGLHALQVAQQKRLRERRDVAVPVDEAGEQRVPLQVEALRLRVGGKQRVGASGFENAAVFLDECLGGFAAGHRADRTVQVNGFHFKFPLYKRYNQYTGNFSERKV